MKTKGKPIEELGRVVLITEMTDGFVPAGTIGVVTQAYNQGKAFKVEFKGIDGATGMNGEPLPPKLFNAIKFVD